MKVADLGTEAFSHFYATYLDTMGDTSLMDGLVQGKTEFHTVLDALSEDHLGYRYAEGKWSIGEVLMHLIDSERVFQYRAFRFSRNDKTPLPGFDQDLYVEDSTTHGLRKARLRTAFDTVRNASIALFETFDDEILRRSGEASGLPWSVGSLGLVMSGHQRHHFKIIRERYL